MANTVSYIIQIKDRFKTNLTKFNKAIEKGSKLTKKLSFDLKKLGKSARDLGKKLTTRLTLPIVAIGTGSVIAFSRLQSGLTDVLNLLEKGEIKEFGEQLKTVRNNAIRMGFSIQDTNKALFDTVSALGLSNQTFETFDISQKLAIAGATDLGVAVDGITSIVNAYGREFTNSTEVANAFFSAQVKGKTTVAALASNIGKVAPIAKGAGVGFKELLATVSGLTLGGLSTEESVTALRAALSALSRTTGQGAKILRQMGVPVGAVQVKAAGLRNTLIALDKAAKKYPEKFREGLPNVRAATAVLSLTEDKIKLIDSALLKMGNDFKNGTGLLEGYSRKMKDVGIITKKARGAIILASASIGKELSPFVIKAAKAIEFMANWFSELNPQIKKFIIIFAGILTIAGPIIFVLGGIATAAAAVGLSLGWVFIISAAITGLIIGLTFLEKKFGLISKFNKSVKEQGINQLFGLGPNINNTTELRNGTQTEGQTNQKVDVSGLIKIGLDKGAELKTAKFNPFIGINVASAG